MDASKQMLVSHQRQAVGSAGCQLSCCHCSHRVKMITSITSDFRSRFRSHCCPQSPNVVILLLTHCPLHTVASENRKPIHRPRVSPAHSCLRSNNERLKNPKRSELSARRTKIVQHHVAPNRSDRPHHRGSTARQNYISKARTSQEKKDAQRNHIRNNSGVCSVSPCGAATSGTCLMC